MDFLSTSALLASGAVLLVQEILKLKIVPLTFANKYPVPTNIILSVIASIVIVHLKWSMHDVGTDLAQLGSVAVVAAIAYNMLLAKWDDLRAMEG